MSVLAGGCLLFILLAMLLRPVDGGKRRLDPGELRRVRRFADRIRREEGLE